MNSSLISDYQIRINELRLLGHKDYVSLLIACRDGYRVCRKRFCPSCSQRIAAKVWEYQLSTVARMLSPRLYSVEVFLRNSPNLVKDFEVFRSNITQFFNHDIFNQVVSRELISLTEITISNSIATSSAKSMPISARFKVSFALDSVLPLVAHEAKLALSLNVSNFSASKILKRFSVENQLTVAPAIFPKPGSTSLQVFALLLGVFKSQRLHRHKVWKDTQDDFDKLRFASEVSKIFSSQSP